MWRLRIVAAGLAAAAAVPFVAGASGGSSAGGWQSVPRGPLSPREGALGLWTGSEVLVVGGSDTSPCPPSAGCLPVSDPPLADGAAYDPVRRSWRRIAGAPAGFEFATGAVVGRRAYFLGDNSPARRGPARVMLAYRIGADRWRRLRPPARDRRVSYRLLGAGSRLLAFGGGRGHPPFKLLAGSRWRRLPPDGLGHGNGRMLAWSGRELVALTCGPSDGSTPCLLRAAVFDFAARTWRRLPDSEIQMAGGIWWGDGQGRIVNPLLGSSDGGAVNGWGRSYPNGGVLDVQGGSWGALPNPPSANEWEGTGVLTPAGAEYGAAQGYVLDLASSTWLRIPPLAYAQSRTVVAAGRDLFAFGGARFDDRGRGRLLGTARIWSPG